MSHSPWRMVAVLAESPVSGLLAVLAAAAAVLLINGPGRFLYQSITDAVLLGHSLTLWVNDGLMALFFLLVGIEIRRDLGQGSAKALLGGAGLAALGGMIVPAGIMLALTADQPIARQGWAIPTATDIAFSLAVLGLLPARARPPGLRLFLTTLAILDDLGAVLLLLLFYQPLPTRDAIAILAGLAVGLWAIGRRWGARLPLGVWLGGGVGLWLGCEQAGCHPALAGVLLAVLLPAGEGARAPMRRLEHALHPLVALGIVPLFAFVNAGVDLSGGGWTGEALRGCVGIGLGLLIGKPVGVLAGWRLAVALRICPWPERGAVGMALLCGIGFTMSLFILTLAYPGTAGDALASAGKAGILAGSVLAAVCGGGWLLWESRSFRQRP